MESKRSHHERSMRQSLRPPLSEHASHGALSIRSGLSPSSTASSTVGHSGMVAGAPQAPYLILANHRQGASSPAYPRRAPKPDLWLAAFKQVQKKERGAFRQLQIPTKFEALRALVAVAEKEQLRCEKERWKYSLCGREYILSDLAVKIAIWIQEYIRVGGIAASTNPIHLGIPWAAVRVLLNAAASSTGQTGALLVCLERTTQVIARCGIYETLYLGWEAAEGVSQELEIALTALYTFLLQNLAKALNTFHRESVTENLTAFAGDLPEFVKSSQDLERRVSMEVRNCQVIKFSQKLQELRPILRRLKEPFVRVNKSGMEMFDVVSAIDRARILDWISSVKYSQIHKQTMAIHTPGTGEWLQAEQSFHDWRSSSASITLWLHGDPGVGKTMLTASAIQALSDTLKTADEGLAYFYCNREDSGRRKTAHILRSFVRQLSCRCNDENVYTMIRVRYEEDERKGFPSGKEDSIDCEECHLLLSELVELYPQVTLCIDALDECDIADQIDLIRIVDDLTRESSKPVKVLFSTRRSEQITKRFERDMQVEVNGTVVRDDISEFVRHRLSLITNWPSNSSLLKEEVRNVIGEETAGSFQWAKLQIEEFVRLSSESDIRNEMKNLLPIGLDQAYDEVWRRIEIEGKDRPNIARRAFQWLICTVVPFSPSRLVAAVCQDPDSIIIESTDLDIDSVLYACRQLLVVDPLANVNKCRFSHLSAQEHFEKSNNSNSDAHSLAARVCLKILTLTDFTYWDPQQHIGSFVHYAVLCWFSHVQMLNPGHVDSRVSTRLQAFLGSMHHSANSYKAWLDIVPRTVKTFSEEPDKSLQMDLILHHPYIRDGTLRPSERPVITMARFGFGEILQDWWNSGLPNANFQNRKSVSLLQLAACSGSIWIARKLLEDGARINYVNESGHSALTLAASFGNYSMVEFLLQSGARTKHSVATAIHPVVEAMDKDHEDIAVLLLRSGASLKSVEADVAAKLLLQAAELRHTSTVKLLVERGAEYDVAISIACISGSSITVHYLLECGSSIDGLNGLALKRAAATGQETMVMEILTQHATDAESRQRALCYAAAFGRESTMKLLINHDASLTVSGDCINRALLCAVHGGHASIVRFLVENGAPIHSLSSTLELLIARFIEFDPPGFFRTVVLDQKSRAGNRAPSPPTLLYYTIINMDVELAAILFKQGINVNLRLENPATHDQDGAIKENPGGDTRPRRSFTALGYTCAQGKLDMLRLLLANKVQVNNVDIEFGSALCAAVESKHTPVVRSLLRHGADVHGPTRSPSHSILDVALADSPVSSEMVGLLREYGARRKSGRDSRRASTASRASFHSNHSRGLERWSTLPSEMAIPRLDPRSGTEMAIQVAGFDPRSSPRIRQVDHQERAN